MRLTIYRPIVTPIGKSIENNVRRLLQRVLLRQRALRLQRRRPRMRHRAHRLQPLPRSVQYSVILQKLIGFIK